MRPEVERILTEVEGERGVTRAQLLAATRSSAHVAQARQEAMRRVRAAFPQASWSEIGRLFGRDRTTVRHACQKVTNVRTAAPV